MTKIVYIGSVPLGRRSAKVFCKVKLEDGKLSISGVEGPTANGNAIGSCGQIDGGFKHLNPAHDDKRYHNLIEAEDIKFAAGWNVASWLKFLEVWHDWHLNDLQAACEHQRALGWTFETHRGQKCPTCGYEIGTAWHTKPLTPEVHQWFASLPESEVKPAWV